MTPEQIFARIDGMLGYQASGVGGAQAGSALSTAQGNTALQEWGNMLKVLLRGPAFRYLTDYEFTLSTSITDVGIVVDTTATHLIAGCFEVSGDLGTDTQAYAGYTDADSDTIDITSALSVQEDVVFVTKLTDLVTSTQAEYIPFILFAGTGGVEATAGTYAQTGLGLTTGLTVWADGNDGNAATAASVRAWTLYRT